MDTPIGAPVVTPVASPQSDPAPAPIIAEAPIPAPVVDSPIEAPVVDTPIGAPVVTPVASPQSDPVPAPIIAEAPVPAPVVDSPIEAPVVNTPIGAPVVATCGGIRSTVVVAPIMQYYDAFANMRSNFYWPTPMSDPDEISSTFGPRKKFSSGDRYDWHRGVDISGSLGDEVLASYTGIVVKAEDVGDGGLTVVLEHSFTDAVVQFHGHVVEKWYTYYNHLSVMSVSPTDVVAAGQKIGEMGKTGAAAVDHLHHEVRIGTYCSLEWAVSNPTSSCNTFFFDPHVHPFLVYPASTIPCSDFTAVVSQEPTATTDARVKISTEDRVPDINHYSVQLVEPGWLSDTILNEYTLDLNLRTGFDASSIASLDTQDISKPYLDPERFLTLDTYWIMDFVIPKSWVGPKSATQEFVVTITNTWHDTWKTIRFGKDISWD